MPDLNDFYAYKTTTSGSNSGGERSHNFNNGGSGNSGCTTALLVLAIIGWVLWLIGK